MPVVKNCSFQALVFLCVCLCFAVAAQAAITVGQDDLDLDRVTGQSLDEMRHLKILFGHQSIGMNTIMGLKDLSMQDARYRLVIANVFSPADFTSPELGHFKISVNGPLTSVYGSFIRLAFLVKLG